MLTQDQRTLGLLNPDRILLHSFNLGRMIESADCDARELGLTLSLYLLRYHPTLVLADICMHD